jgi:hypothetical protein
LVLSRHKSPALNVEKSALFAADFHWLNAPLSRTRVGDPLGGPSCSEF